MALTPQQQATIASQLYTAIVNAGGVPLSDANVVANLVQQFVNLQSQVQQWNATWPPLGLPVL